MSKNHISVQPSSDSCELCSFINAEPINIDRHGARLLTVRATVENVCPGKRVAIAVIVYDQNNRILAFKGFITKCESCGSKEDRRCTIERKVVFVLPDTEETEPEDLRVRTIANYIYPCN